MKIENLKDYLTDSSAEIVLYMAPAVRVGIGEFYNLPPVNFAPKIITALKQIGVKFVYDMSFAADLTTVEETVELLEHLEGGLTPMFSSCCPGWIKMAQLRFPELAHNISTCKSPQAMFGSILRRYHKPADGKKLIIVSLVPCAIKKQELLIPEYWTGDKPDIDMAITTGELATLLHDEKIDLPNLPDTPFDGLFGESAGARFGARDGVMMSMLNTFRKIVIPDGVPLPIVEDVSGGVRTMQFVVGEINPVPEFLKHKFATFEFLRGRTVRMAAVNSVPSINKIIDSIKNDGEFSIYDFIEFMMCMGGCVGGAGQKITANPEDVSNRVQSLLGVAGNYKTALDNPAVWDFYENTLKDGIGSDVAEKLLHRIPG